MNKNILQEKLKSDAISQRSNGKVSLDYIESHHAIREANRAFDFDGWSYEVSQLNQVQNETKTNKHNKELHYVSYTAMVKIAVIGEDGNIALREDIGFGQGIDADLGKAHEGATKEAVSDAQKRALRTFGDIFGLALYDKKKEHVEMAVAPSNGKQNGKNSNQAIQSTKPKITIDINLVKQELATALNIDEVPADVLRLTYSELQSQNIDMVNGFYDNKELILNSVKQKLTA